MRPCYSIRTSAIKTISFDHGVIISSSVNDKIYQNEQIESLDSYLSRKKNVHLNLNLDNISKMIQRFLFEKHMPVKKLAKLLGITAEELKQISSKRGLLRCAYKINLPLVKLYCKTKWTKNKSRKSLS